MMNFSLSLLWLVSNGWWMLRLWMNNWIFLVGFAMIGWEVLNLLNYHEAFLCCEIFNENLTTLTPFLNCGVSKWFQTKSIKFDLKSTKLLHLFILQTNKQKSSFQPQSHLISMEIDMLVIKIIQQNKEGD
jgi:hypothetical protein